MTALDPQGSPETREAAPASSEKFVELLVAISADLCERGAFLDSTVDEIHMIGWLAGAFEGLMADRARLERQDAVRSIQSRFVSAVRRALNTSKDDAALRVTILSALADLNEANRKLPALNEPKLVQSAARSDHPPVPETPGEPRDA